MFLNWTMLAGLGGAAVPLVLHLLARARYRNIDWGAMMFLAGVDPRQASAARLRQAILLILRMGMIALLAVALAQPIVRGRSGALGQEGQITAVIVLDCSYSMGVEEAGRTRFEKAREAARQVLWGLERGSEVSLIVLGDRVELLHREPTSNLQSVARDLDSLQVSNSQADFATGLAIARQVLTQPSRTNRELYLITDRQAGNWRRMDAAAPYVRWISDSSPRTRFYVIPVGGEESDNVAIESMELLDPVAIKGLAADVEVRIHNYGATPRQAMELTVSGASRRQRPAPVNIPARSTTAVRVPVSFDAAGSHVLTAEIKSPGLDADNRFDLAVDVIDPIQVLIVSGDETGALASRESFFIKLALTPFQSLQNKGGDPAVVTVRTADAWGGEDLSKYQVIVLANVPRVPFDLARSLEQRVYEGAGLIICPGNLVSTDSYNATLYRGGQGLMPARLENAVAADGSAATSLLGLELTHPIFRFQRGSDPLPAAVIGRYFPVIPRQAEANTLATYSSGEAFLIEGPRGRGKVLLLTTSLDLDWNTLPLYPFYLPFVQSLVKYACASSGAPRNVRPGEALVANFDQALESADLFFADEKGISLVGSRGSNQVRYSNTYRPGVYRLRVKLKGRDRTIHFVVQPPRDESDLSAVTSAQWDQYASSMGFRRLDPGQGAIGPVLAADRGGRDLWLPLLVCAIGAGVAEMSLARAWSGRGS